MELNQLKQFQVVAKYENISRASEELYISQPSLTRAMYNLENDLGVSLFERKKNKIKLNNCGKHILKQVDIILNEAELLKKNGFGIYRTQRDSQHLFINAVKFALFYEALHENESAICSYF